MLNLDQKHNSNSIFEVLYAGKSKTFVCSSYSNNNAAILSDWSGNIWCISLSSKRKVWEHKIEKPIVFDFIEYSNRLFAFNANSLLEINIDSGLIRELLTFKNITSVTSDNDKIYLNERDKNGFDSLGQIVEISLNDLTQKVILKEKTKRTFGPLHRKEIISTGREILFYADKSIFSYSPLDANLHVLYTNSQIRDQVNGLTMLDSTLLFIPSIRNENAGTGHFSENPDVNSISFLTTGKDTGVIDLTAVMTTTSYEGSSIQVAPGNCVSTLGSYIFFYRDNTITKIDVPNRRVGGRDCKLFRHQNKTYLFEPCSYGDRAEETGFRLYEIGDRDLSIQLKEEFITNKVGRNFKGCCFDFFGDHIIVRGDGRYYILEM